MNARGKIAVRITRPILLKGIEITPSFFQTSINMSKFVRIVEPAVVSRKILGRVPKGTTDMIFSTGISSGLSNIFTAINSALKKVIRAIAKDKGAAIYRELSTDPLILPLSSRILNSGMNFLRPLWKAKSPKVPPPESYNHQGYR